MCTALSDFSMILYYFTLLEKKIDLFEMEILSFFISFFHELTIVKYFW